MVPVGAENPYLLPRINLPQKLSEVILLLHYMRQPNTEAKARWWFLCTILLNLYIFKFDSLFVYLDRSCCIGYIITLLFPYEYIWSLYDIILE